MQIGYARISTRDQDAQLQLDALKAAGCVEIVQEVASGAGTERPGLRQVADRLAKGDVLVVWKLDRLGRSVKGLIDLMAELERKEAGFRSLSDGINTADAMGRFFFHVMAAFAQMERELLRERTRAGLAVAKARGRVGGRPRAMDATKVEVARKLIDSGVPIRDIAASLHVSIPTLYRYFPSSTST